MLPPENKTVINSFVEEVINHGRFQRADDLVAVDFLELDPPHGWTEHDETAWCHS
jgi:hypothetical protein